MNFVGKFDAKLPPDALGSHSHAYVHVEHVTGNGHAPADAIIVPDAQLLFNGDFKRAGVDLILSRDGHELVLQDYFKGEQHAALASPDGAHLTGSIVDALTGHTQYAQVDGSASVAKIIGHVAKLTGTATAIRNGVSITLNQGDNVEKGDVVQSGANSTVGITFIDGTVFGLSSNARMVLNEMVYDPNGSNNSSLISLVAGTISFVAGETAKHGDMKIDTPVATMGIRGTAVVFAVDFNVQGVTPDAEIQVLLEPDGHMGSFKVYEKGTLNELYTVDETTPHLHYHDGHFTPSSSPLTTDVQKLITDLFALKFTDANPKTNDHHTDFGVLDTLLPFYTASGAPVAPVWVYIPTIAAAAPAAQTGSPGAPAHVPLAPSVLTSGNSFIERPGVTHSPAIDTVSGLIKFADINVGDTPSATTAFTSFTYQNAQGADVTGSLSALQLKDIALVEAQLVVVAAPGNTNTGSATWTYNVADKAFDFLAAGETLTLTYTAEVDSNYAPDDLKTFVPFTITITGTNDAPVITTGPESVAYAGGKFTPGGNLHTVGNVPTTGSLSFTDVDLTDTHTVATALTGASMSGSGVPTLDMAALDALAPAPMAAFETALSAVVATDATGTGCGTINWTLADLPVYLADFIPTGEVLTLTYTVTVTDEHGATSEQTVTVTITGTDAAAVVWIATTQAGSSGDWNDASNWETGTVPTAGNDVIIITDQLIGKTPFYPVTINAAAYANSLTMNDFGTLFTNQPTLINNSTLTVGVGGVSLSADSIVDNYGTIVVGGLMEVLQQSSLQNYGKVTLQEGGDFKDQSTITNFGSGTIEVAGGTLDVQVGVANFGKIIVDLNAILTLDGATISGGTIDDTGTLSVSGSSEIENATVEGGGSLTVASGQVLTLDTVTLDDVTLSGSITDASTITIDDTVTLDGATISGGNLTIASGSTLDIETGASGSGATLDGVSVTQDVADAVTGMIEVGVTSMATLLLDDGTTITNGDLTIGSGSTLDVETGASGSSNPDATLDDVAVANHGAIEVGETTSNAILYLEDGTTVTGGTLSTLNGGLIEVAYNSAFSSNTVTFDGSQTDDPLTIDGAVQIDAGATLTLLGTIDNNGTITVDGQVIAAPSGTLLISGDVILGGTGTGSVVLDGTGDAITGVSATDTLENVNNDISGFGQLGDGGLTLINDLHGTIDATDATNALIIDTGTGTFTNSGLVESDGAGGLEIKGDVINDGTLEALAGTLKVDGDVTSSGDIPGTAVIDGGTMEFGGASNANVQFSGSGTLVLDDFNLTGAISGFGAGDVIDLTDNLKLSSSVTDLWNSANHTLTVSDGAHTATLNFSGSYGQNSFALTSDASGNTEVVSTLAQVSVSGFDAANDAAEGSIVTATLTELNATNITYQWLDDGVAISGANSATYTPVAGDLGAVLDVVVGFTVGGVSEQMMALAGTVVAAPAVNDTTDGPSVTTNENVALTLTGLTVTDADAGSHSITVTLDVGDGTLTLGTELGVTETNIGSNAVSLSGTVAAIDALLASGVTYTPTSGFTGTDTLTYQAIDAAVSSNTGNITIDVTSPGPAADNWTGNAGDGEWSTAGNWDNGVPGAESEVNVAVSGAVVTFDLSASPDTIYSLATSAGTTLDITAGTLTITEDNGANVSGTLVLEDGAKLKGGTLSIGASGEVQIEHPAASGPSATFDDVDVENLGTIQVDSPAQPAISSLRLSDGTTITGGTLSIGSIGVVEIESGSISSVVTLDRVTVSDGKTLQIDNGATLALDGATINGSGTITNNGTFEVTGGTTSVASTVIFGGIGAIKINGGTADFHDTITQNVAFSGAGTLGLAQSSYGGTVSGFGAGDKIDLANLTYSGTATDVWDQSTGTLTISSGGVHDVLHLAGAYTQSDFALIGVALGGITVTWADTIAQGAAYTVSAPSSDTIVFAGSTGTLDLTQPSTFTGEVAGISGTGDVLDIHGFAAATTTAVTGSGSFNSATDTTTLTVTDTSDHLTETFTLAGNLSASTWTVTDDHNGGVKIVDPPAVASLAIATGVSLEIANPVAVTEGITFDGSTGHLTLDAPSSFAGVISGFTGDGTLAGTDQIDLKGIDYHSSSFTESFDAAADTLSVSDGTNGATLHFSGSYQAANFSFISDGNGGTIVFDPPVPGTPNSTSGGWQPPTTNPTSTGSDGSPGFAGGATDQSNGAIGNASTGSFTVVDSHSTTDQSDGTLGNVPTGSFKVVDSHSITDQSSSGSPWTSPAANFSFISDGNGGTVVFDPPVSGTPDSNNGGSQAPVPNPTSADGSGGSQGFAFNFTGGQFHSTPDQSGGTLGNGPTDSFTVVDSHSITDQFSTGLLWTSPSGSNADSHSTTDQFGSLHALSILQAQLHSNGFHVV